MSQINPAVETAEIDLQVHEQQTTNLAVGNENLAFAEVSLDTGQFFCRDGINTKSIDKKQLLIARSN